MDEKYIDEFLKGLRETIARNEAKGKGDSWFGMSIDHLFSRLGDEKRELAIEMCEDFRRYDRVASEALDVALIAMFIYIVAKNTHSR
jgi:hypothetical protein